jgi:hypothetical protein
MNKKSEIGLDFIIDELTNSVRNVISGDSFQTTISRITPSDIKAIAKQKTWLFDWKIELSQPERDVFKLTIVNNQNIIQGLISLEVKIDHVFIHLIESASFNKGKSKVYFGVPGNLVAFACKLSFQRGHNGFVSFFSKTKLIDHYIESLGAIHLGGRLMIIDIKEALNLVNKYYSNLAL